MQEQPDNRKQDTHSGGAGEREADTGPQFGTLEREKDNRWTRHITGLAS